VRESGASLAELLRRANGQVFGATWTERVNEPQAGAEIEQARVESEDAEERIKRRSPRITSRTSRKLEEGRRTRSTRHRDIEFDISNRASAAAPAAPGIPGSAKTAWTAAEDQESRATKDLFFLDGIYLELFIIQPDPEESWRTSHTCVIKNGQLANLAPPGF